VRKFQKLSNHWAADRELLATIGSWGEIVGRRRSSPSSKLKIDRSFVRDVAVNPDDAAITTAIIAMAKGLRLKVIAEGGKDEAQMAFLRLGVGLWPTPIRYRPTTNENQRDEIQGYYFSKPLSAEKVADMLQDTLVRASSASGA
jgi:predicted signal transduction protein with EAL and GGDEF domain